MRPALAPTALMLAVLALAGSAAADPYIVMPDLGDRLDPTAESGHEIQEALFSFIYDGAASVTGVARVVQERLDQARLLGDSLAEQGEVAVNRCAIGSELPRVAVPRGSAELEPDVAGWTATANAWNDDLSGPLNAEAACRALQAKALGAPAVAPPALPAMAALPDVPDAPEAPGPPAIPDLALPELELPIPA